MKTKYVIGVVILAALLAAGYGAVRSTSGNSESGYRLTEVSRGDLESTISCSGTLSPVTTVEIGTQVSGTIDSVFVDFNDEVHVGQLLAVLDTTLLKAAVLDAEAGVERAEAQLALAEDSNERSQSLYERKLIPDSDLLTAEMGLKTQKANLTSAEVGLTRALRNLDYAIIISPIDGTVISRNVESGQTVAASLSTPTLFLIAQDLSHMEILVEVDESDIGQIEVGQQVRFEVQAHADEIFEGSVTQVRLQPETVSNVVTYTVVVDASNERNLLLPGMTATVDFIIDQREDVLQVANAALRYSPSDDDLTEFMERRQAEREAIPDSVRAARRGGMPPGGPGSGMGGNASSNNFGRLWYLDDDGLLQMAPVKTGMTDGSSTEIVMARDIEEGTQVISGSSTGTTTSSSKSQMRMPGGPPRGF